MQNDVQLDAALDLMRRLPPQRIDQSLNDLVDLVPGLTEELLTSIDQPLKVARCSVTGKDYLLCDYNRDGDSYRSVRLHLTEKCFLASRYCCAATQIFVHEHNF